MRVVVCVKQVPEVTEVRIDPDTNTLVREGIPSIVNPFDEFAVEEGLRIRERVDGEVTVISMGPPQAEEALRTCLAMGADRAFLLTDARLAGSDTLATSLALSRVIEKIGFDLILCGQETIDSSTGQVGPELAEHLMIPQVTFVNRIQIEEDAKTILVHKETERGYQVIRCSIPALISVVKGINDPRLPEDHVSKEPVRLEASYLDCSPDLVGADGSPTRVVQIKTSQVRKRQGFMIDSTLPASERLKLIMSGGIQQKATSIKLTGEPDEAAQKTVDFIVDYMKDELADEPS